MAKFEKKKIEHNQTHICCPVCDTNVKTISYVYRNNNTQSDFYSCKNCSFIFARTELIESLDERQMDSVDDAEMFNSPFLKKLYTLLFIKTELRKLRKHATQKTMKLLDIGCGTGWTTSVYSQNGFNVTGLEPSTIRAEIAREKYNLTIINDYIENISKTEKFDIIVLRHFLEHLSNPKTVISKIQSSITKKGYIVIVVPNINSLGRYLFETDWTWVLPWHCSFFSPDSIRILMEKSNFEVLECYQTPSPLYFMESLLRKISKKKLTTFFHNKPFFAKIISAFFSSIGTMAGKGENVTIIARKK